MSNRSNRPGTELTSSEIAAITSLDLLETTPAGYHIAKNALGNFVNTPDTGGGTSYTFQNGVVESAGVVELGGSGALTSLNINGAAGNGHIHLKHQSTNPTSQANSSTIFALASGRAGWINDGLGTETLAYLSDIPGGLVYENGITQVGSNIQLGGQLIQETHIDANGQLLFIEDTVNGSGLTLNTTQVTLVSGNELEVTAGGTLRQTAATHYELRTPAVYNTTAVAGQVLTLINASTGEAEYQTVGGGGGNSTIVTLDFGTNFTDKAQTTVTGLSWVSTTSKIVAQVMTPTGVDPDEMILLDLKPIISDIVDGVGFTVTLYSEPEAKGVYNVMCLGN